MRTYDLTPLLRSTVGFDRFNRLFDAASRVSDDEVAYPPYNIERSGDNDYRITMAVAGFPPEDLDVTQQENLLVVSGKAQTSENGRVFLHRGIAGRAFERRFELADNVKVSGASLEYGFLHIDLAREVPEALKPRRVSIHAGEAPSRSKPTANAA